MSDTTTNLATMNPSEYPSHATNVQPSSQWEAPANTAWPAADVARRLNDVPLDKQIPVTVRLAYTGGDEWHDGVAVRWTGNHVYVRVQDSRLNSGGCWVFAGDVSRR